MKPNLPVLILLLPLAASLNANAADHADKQHGSSEQSQSLSPAAILSDQVQDIAASSALSPKSKSKLIANAVRTAINSVTAGIHDPAKRLELALELTTAAAKAAPQFATTITNAVANISSIAKIDGALDEIRDAVKKGQDQSDDTDTANPSRGDSHNHGHHEFEGPGDHDHPVVSPSH